MYINCTVNNIAMAYRSYFILTMPLLNIYIYLLLDVFIQLYNFIQLMYKLLILYLLYCYKSQYMFMD